MKKICTFILIVIINLILLLLIDYGFFYYIEFKRQNISFTESIEKYIKFTHIIDIDESYLDKVNNNYFRDFKKESSKRSILIFGCSFGYGYLLKPEQSLSYKLSEHTGRSVFNRSISSLGIQYVPYIAEHYNIEKTISNPEYIIFVMIDNHLYRLYREIMNIDEPYFDILYQYNGKILEERKPIYSFLFKSSIIRYINLNLILYMYNKKNQDEIFDFMKAHFLKMKSILNKKFPNSKLVILQYEENENSWIFNNPRWNELRDEGFIIINSYELTNEHLFEEKYRIPNDVHPNEKAWDLLVPKLVERLEL